MKNLKVCIVCLAVLVPVCSGAHSFGGFYAVGVPFVRYLPYAHDPDYEVDFDTCFKGIGFEARFDINPLFGIEANLSYFPEVSGDVNDSGLELYALRRWDFGLGGRVTPLSGRFMPYASAGVSLVSTNFVYDDTRFGYEWTGYNLGAYVGGGLLIALTEYIVLDLNPVYTFIANPKDHEDEHFRKGGFFDIRIGAGYEP
ncbi:MAG: porin family protein [bacterium]|nr:porin family protein [bacterium]